MRRALATLLLLACAACAQDMPLGDIARRNHERKSQSGHAAKVVTDDDMRHSESTASVEGKAAINEDDDPLAVYQRAGAAQMKATSFQCRKDTNGNSGPGWADSTLTEIAGPNQVRIVEEKLKPGHSRTETIMLPGIVYSRTDDQPWQESRIGPNARLAQGILPEFRAYAFKPGELKFIGRSTIDGAPVMVYQYSVNNSQLIRSITYWINSADGLPVQWDMTTNDHLGANTWISSHEATRCSYGVPVTVAAPR